MRLVVSILLAALLAQPAAAARFDARLEAAQRALTAQGFDPGPIDGLMGRRTRAALTAFQKSRSLPASGKLDAATAAALGTGTPEPPTPAAPLADAPASPAPPEPAAPARLAAKRAPGTLAYTRLGWTAPGSAAAARERSEQVSGIGDVRRRSGDLLVPDVSQIFLIRKGERLDGERCDPAAGEPAMEFLVGPDGPVSFVGARTAPLCQLGTGIVLREGMTLRMVETYWGDTRVPSGRVRVGGSGLEYVE